MKIVIIVLVSTLFLVCNAGCSLARSITEPAPPVTSGTTRISESTNAPAATNTLTDTASNESQADQAQRTDELHTPAKGSPERQAIMDALRALFDDRHSPAYEPHRGNITFVVSFLKVHNGWAWVNAEPQSSDPGDSFGENSGFLLQAQNQTWKVMALPPMVDDPDDPENLDYPSPKDIERIKRKYPSVPRDIFPRPNN